MNAHTSLYIHLQRIDKTILKIIRIKTDKSGILDEPVNCLYGDTI
jgi:hypothetical protein